MNGLELKKLINWVINRLEYKYKENIEIISSLKSLEENFIFIPKKIPIKFVDNICKKHYPDFDMEKTSDLNFGFNEKERMILRNFVINILSQSSELES
jgi:hypothetical protein